MEKLWLSLPEEADRVTVCDEDTAATDAVKATVVAPDATVALAGTETAEPVLESAKVTPEADAASLSVMVQDREPAPVMEDLLQVRELRVAEVELDCTSLFTENPAQPERDSTAPLRTNPAVRADKRVLV